MDPDAALTVLGVCALGLVVLGLVVRRDLAGRPPRDQHDETPTNPGLRLVE